MRSVFWRGGIDELTVSNYAVGEFDEYQGAAVPHPGDPPIQGLLSSLTLDRKNVE